MFYYNCFIFTIVAPSPPQDVKYSEETYNSFVLKWDPPADGDYVGFDVDIHEFDEGTGEVYESSLEGFPVTVNSDVFEYRFERLRHDTPYTASVTTLAGIEGLMEQSEQIDAEDSPVRTRKFSAVQFGLFLHFIFQNVTISNKM